MCYVCTYYGICTYCGIRTCYGIRTYYGIRTWDMGYSVVSMNRCDLLHDLHRNRVQCMQAGRQTGTVLCYPSHAARR